MLEKSQVKGSAFSRISKQEVLRAGSPEKVFAKQILFFFFLCLHVFVMFSKDVLKFIFYKVRQCSGREREPDWRRLIAALPLGHCVTLNKLINLLMPQFPLLENRDDNVIPGVIVRHK